MKRVVLALSAFLITPLAAWASPEVEIALSHHAGLTEPPNAVEVVATNHGSEAVYIHTYSTPFALPDGRMTGGWFSITDAFGNNVAYRGRWVLVRGADSSSYTRIAPGEHLTATVDLGLEYALPVAARLSVSTSITVLERMPEFNEYHEASEVPSLEVTSNTVQFVVASDLTSFPSNCSSIIKCTEDQLAATKRAILGAKTASYEALQFLSSLYYMDPIDPENPNPPRVHMKPHLRYQYWFGTWDDLAPQPPDPGYPSTDNSRVDQTVMATYVRLLGGANAVCDVCKGYSPWTRAWNEVTLIHLCPINFSDPVNGGITSQAGTIVHEVTHQADADAPATIDIKGVTNRATAHRLSRPQAVQSGANYEYFIMNVPLGRSQSK